MGNLFIKLSSLLTLTSLVSLNANAHDQLLPASYELSPKQIETFQQDGLVVIRGLLKGQELKDATKTVNRMKWKKSLGQRLLYRFFPSYCNLEFQTWRNNPALEKVAFESAAPTICAKLMGLDRNDDGDGDGDGVAEGEEGFRPLRLLKDAVLGYKAGDTGCGWHVDDKFFWPCEDRNIGERDAGINVWITLSPVTAAEGGGLALVPGSHRAPFAEKARKAIQGGFSQTCFLEKLAPDCNEEMEKLKVVYDLEPGDAIFHDRYIFHRGDPFVDENKNENKNKNKIEKKGRKLETKQRISLRYVPADATFYDNYSEKRVVQARNLSTGDPVSKGCEYFPQTWPRRLPQEKSIKALAEQKTSLKSVISMVLSIARAKKTEN